MLTFKRLFMQGSSVGSLTLLTNLNTFYTAIGCFKFGTVMYLIHFVDHPIGSSGKEANDSVVGRSRLQLLGKY